MRIAVVAGLVLSGLATVAKAQNIPLTDVAAGYAMLQVVKGSSLTAEGGSGSVALNFNNWVGAVGDFALHHSAGVGPGLAAGTYTFGPRFSYRRWGRVTPFTQVLLGGVRYADNGFVFGTGGGADIALDHGGRFALRPQVEYFGFRANGTDYHTVRVCVGLVFRIGRKTV